MPASSIKIGGTPIDNAILERVEVTQALNEHWRCTVECRQTEDIRMSVEDSLGQDLQVLTTDQQGGQQTVFEGFVLEATIVYEPFGSYTARFTGITKSYKLDLTEQEAYYRKKTLQDVASALAGADGLSADVKCQSRPAKNYVQWGESDFQWLKRMAYEHEAWIRPTGQGIEICDSFQGGSQLAWRQEGSLLQFETEGRLSQASFNGTHYNARQMTSSSFQQVQTDADFSGASDRLVSAVKSQSASSLPSGYWHVDSRTATADEYQDALKRESVRSIGGSVVGHGFSQNSALKAGDSLSIAGPMDGNGTYGLTKVVHRWNRRGYKNEFWCTPWNNYFHPEGLAPRQMPGVVLGRVFDHNDPRKMGRIQVQYDWQGGSQTGWARMVSPHSGSDRGLMFMPEKGDEVLIGFEYGDAERPFILGALWNGVDSAPRQDFWGGDIEGNDVKRIVTKSGHRIQFSDKDGKESIVISTPSKLKISLLENADETGRSMILLHSDDGDIFFSAPDGRIHLHAKHLSRETGNTSEDEASPSPDSPPPAPKSAPPPAAPPAPAASAAAPKAASSVAKSLWDKGKPFQKTTGPELEAGVEPNLLEGQEVGASVNWVNKKGAAKKWGSDADNVQLGAYSAQLSSGITKEDGGYSADLIKGQVSATAFQANEERKAFGGVLKGTGELNVLSASASAEVGAKYSDEAKEVTAQVGAEADLAKAKIGGELNIPVPFTNKVLTVGGGVEGMAGAAAKAGVAAGWTQQDGYVASAEAKAAVGLGLGTWFKLGLKDKEKKEDDSG